MNRTTQILLVVGALLVASYPGFAWLTGLLVEHRIERAEGQVTLDAPYAKILRRDYRRGVYRSTEVITYEFRLPPTASIMATAALPSSFTLTLRSEITHGPFPDLRGPALASIDSTLILPASARQEISKVIGSQPIVRARTRVGWFGSTRSTLTSPAFHWRGADGSTFAWSGLTALMRGGRDLSSWSGRITAPGLKLRSADGARFDLRDFAFSGRARRVFGAILAGHNRFAVARIDGEAPRTGMAYALRQAAFTSHTDVHGAFLDMRFKLSTDAAQFGKVSLSHVVYSASVEHLDGVSLARLTGALRAAESQASGNPTLLQAQLRQTLRQYGGPLLLHDPVLKIRRVSFTMPEGTLALSATVSAPGLSPSDLGWPALIAALETHGQITADVSIDDALLRKFMASRGTTSAAAARITTLERQGYLKARANTETLHLRFAGGRLTLNGEPFPPAAPAH